MTLIGDFQELFLSKRLILDVRAPVEFAAGHLPGSVNLPILNDQERAQVGTTYKQQGSAEAIRLGHQLVSGAIRSDRIQAWKNLAKKNPNLVITCFRGGMRSELAQAWLKEAGIEVPRIQGGYKAARRFLLQTIQQESQHPLLILSGSTGAGKTVCLRALDFPSLDLEAIGQHRGSAFGALATAQPAQASFENGIGLRLLELKKNYPDSPWLVEDESRMLGSLSVPEALFLRMRAAALIVIDESLDVRVQNTFDEYIAAEDLSIFLPLYLKAVERISPKLGGLRAQQILSDMRGAEKREDHKIWIEKLLVDYYDPAYEKFLKKWAQNILFKGTRREVEDFLKGNLKICQRCQAIFGCGAKDPIKPCWCMSYPTLKNLPKDLLDCMCPKCLKAALLA